MLPETLEVPGDMPNWSVSEHCTHHGRMSDARRFSGMFSNGRSMGMVNRRGMWRDTDIGALE